MRVNKWCCTRYLPDTWHVILDIWFMTPALGIYTGTWYVILDNVPRHLIFRHQYLIYVILDTCSWYLVYDMLSCGISTMTWHCDPWSDTTTLIPILYDIFMTITFTGTWHDYYIITRYLVLMSSCTPELLYTWTPEIGRLLTLLLILYSCWPL